MDTSVVLCGIPLKNPLIAASGTFGFGREYDRLYDISQLGGISVKGLTLEKRLGNNTPRIAETASGMLNAVGLQNPGVEHFLVADLPFLRQKNIPVFANIAGNTVEDYCGMAARLKGSGVQFIELNISCPNVKKGGAQFGTRPELVYEVTRAVKSECGQPLFVKLSPNVASISETAAAVESAGADGITLINTLTGMAIDPYTRRPILANIVGGLSGPAILPVALRMVYEAHKAVSIPIVGMGGITTGEDAARFMLAGATAVMVGTANISQPLAMPRILTEFQAYLSATGVNAAELTGGLITEPNENICF